MFKRINLGVLAATVVATAAFGAPLANADTSKAPAKHPDLIGVLRHPDRHPDLIGGLKHPDRHPDMRKAGGQIISI
jgi:hypothetical protein